MLFSRKKYLALFLSAAALALFAEENDPALKTFDRPTEVQLKRLGKKVQKITFIQDDSQFNMITRIYVLKYAKASDLAPFIRSAVIRYDPVSKLASLFDMANNRQLLIVTTTQDMMPYVDEMIKVLDRPGKPDKYDSTVYGTGIAYGIYRSRFRAAESMLDIITGIKISTNQSNSRVRLDTKTNTFYFKDTPSRVKSIQEKLQWLDTEIPQVRIELKIYEVRDSDIKDIGIDYLAWKNGPGLNLFEAGYDALNLKVAETIIQQLSQTGIDLAGNFAYGFGGMYTAPAFDFSFIRLLQQNGKAIINSTAEVTLSNEPGSEFKVNFSPEYQNILKDEDHRSSIAVGGDASLEASFTDTVITAGHDCIVNFTCSLTGNNVVERNNLGQEISEKTYLVTSCTIGCNTEQVIASWNRESVVEQTVGIPFLCELPILKYIFGTTTSNMEKTTYFVTARAIPLNIRQDIRSGIMDEFDSFVRNSGKMGAGK